MKKQKNKASPFAVDKKTAEHAKYLLAIVHEAKTNATLADLLNQLKATYLLIKSDDKNNK